MRVLALGKSRTSERIVTLFPEPDSPRRANTLPRSRENVTPFTALTTPSRVWNSTCKSLTVRSATMAKVSSERGGVQRCLLCSAQTHTCQIRRARAPRYCRAVPQYSTPTGSAIDRDDDILSDAPGGQEQEGAL